MMITFRSSIFFSLLLKSVTIYLIDVTNTSIIPFNKIIFTASFNFAELCAFLRSPYTFNFKSTRSIEIFKYLSTKIIFLLSLRTPVALITQLFDCLPFTLSSFFHFLSQTGPPLVNWSKIFFFFVTINRYQLDLPQKSQSFLSSMHPQRSDRFLIGFIALYCFSIYSFKAFTLQKGEKRPFFVLLFLKESLFLTSILLSSAKSPRTFFTALLLHFWL